MEDKIWTLKNLSVNYGKDTPTPSPITNKDFAFAPDMCPDYVDMCEKLDGYYHTATSLAGLFFQTDEHLHEALLDIYDIDLLVELLERQENIRNGYLK